MRMLLPLLILSAALNSHAIAADAEGNMWFGTPKGLVKFDGQNWETTSFKQVFGSDGLFL